MPRHTISHADQLFFGSARTPNAVGGYRGLPMTPIVQANLGAPTAKSATAIVNAQAVAGAGNVATLAATTTGATYGRALEVDSSSAGDTTQTVLITGKDAYGQTMSELFALNGTTNVSGQKAFVTITSVYVSAAMAGNLSVGTLDVLGLPYRLGGAFDVLQKYIDSTEEAMSSGTLAAADGTSPATTTTNDVRGTWLPGTATDGSKVFRMWMKIHDPSSDAGSYGVTQA